MKKLSLLAGMLCVFGANAEQAVPGEYVVKLKKSANLKGFLSQKSVSASIKTSFKTGVGQFAVIKSDSKEVIASITGMDEVDYVEPNFIYNLVKPIETLEIEDILGIKTTLNYSPTDPKFGQLWGLANDGENEPGRTMPGTLGADIDAIKAWQLTTGSRNVKIAVIDTGIDYNHPDLVENMWVNEAEKNGEAGVDDDGNGYVDDIHGYDFANNDGDPIDGHSHGTHCAGTIAAVHNNGEGVAGVMSEATLVAVKFLTDRGSGTLEGAIKAIDYATKVGVDIMSNSWGGGGFSKALEDSIKRASDAGIIFTAAAGNSSTNNDSKPHYPSNYQVPNVVSVAASTAQDGLASFSCYGKSTVHIAAPGHRILSTIKGGGYKAYSGTSMATPHVTGALGLLLAQEGRMDHESMRERLMATSEPLGTLRGKTINSGRLNAYNLLTDTRPERNDPKPGQWQTISLNEVWETAHPYANNEKLERVFRIEGAKFIRLKIKKYELENRYDKIKVSNANRQVAGTITGSGEDFVTDFVEGDTLIANFTSDRSQTKWGFLIEEVEVQY